MYERITMKRLIIAILIISIMISAILFAKKSSVTQFATLSSSNASTTAVSSTKPGAFEQSETPRVEIISNHVQDIL